MDTIIYILGSMGLGVGILAIVRLRREILFLRHMLADLEGWYQASLQEIRKYSNTTIVKDDEAESERVNRLLQGPYRDKPEVDIEFYDTHGAVVGSSVATLKAHVNKYGIVVKGTSDFRAAQEVELHRYAVWFGDSVLEGEINPPRPLCKGDTYRQIFSIPVTLNGGINGNYRAEDPPPPEVPVDDQRQTH